MAAGLLSALENDLQQLERAGRLRACPSVDGTSRIRGQHQGRPVTTFCSNDYLGLAHHPALAEAAIAAIAALGTGAGASRLVNGELAPHRALESALADWLELPAALLFPTGYQANIAVLTSLAGPDDLIVSDQANHASLIDGARLSRARIVVYSHCDARAAAAALEDSHRFRRRLIVTESLFSMDGDRAPLAPLAQLAADHDGVLIVDEAHAIGAMGDGRGLCRAAGVTPDVLIGTLGKAFGSFGGFVAGAAVLRAHLVNRARTFIYTTAQPPGVAAASLAALQLIREREGDTRRARLAANVDRLQRALGQPALQSKAKVGQRSLNEGPIFPVILGPDERAVLVSRRLLDQGFFVPAIRPPTVPEGTARLRITVSAEHAFGEIDALAEALLKALA